MYHYITARFNFGKNSFLTGFGLGFLAFGLKKLLLPIIIGAQIVKSVALAALLPTILGSVGKVVSKGMYDNNYLKVIRLITIQIK